MVKKEEQAKVETDEGQDESKVEQPEVEQGAEPETVTPEPATDEGEEVSEDAWKQKFKTLEGMYKQEKEKNTSFDTLLTEVQGVSSQVKQQGETLELHTEILSAGGDMSEEAQEKIKKARETQEARQKAVKEAGDTLKSITRYSEAAGLTLESEAMKPAKEAWDAGKPKEALDLTVIACIGGKKEVTVTDEKPAEEETKEKETKANLKVLRKTSAPGKSTQDMTSREKIMAGMAEAKRKQG